MKTPTIEQIEEAHAIHWTPWPLALATLGTLIGKWLVIGSKPGHLLLILSNHKKTDL